MRLKNHMHQFFSDEIIPFKGTKAKAENVPSVELLLDAFTLT
jgi:hypothetical protein